jgi:hypothetical protein
MELQKLIDFFDECNRIGLFEDERIFKLPEIDNCKQELEILLLNFGEHSLEKKRKELYGF